jgi:tetratricopeptide (TPR) repeat protein
MKKTFFFFIVLFIISLNNNFVIADDYTNAMLKALGKYKEAADNNDKQLLLKSRGDFERILQLKKNEWMIYYYLGLTDYMLSRIAAEEKNNDDLKKFTESAIDMLNKSADMNDQFAESFILNYAVQSNRWQYEPNKMNDIIARSTEAKETALKLEPKNPRLYLIDGFITFYTPEGFGGGIDKAQVLFEKSWNYFKSYQPKDNTYPNWGYDQAGGMMAMCYIKNNNTEEAKKWIDIVLEKSPDSKFIKYFVLPEYEKISK